MDIREATTDDVPTIRGVAREAWRAAYADAVPDSVIEDAIAAWYADETMERIIGDDEQVCLVAAEGGDILGFAHGATDEDAGGSESTTTKGDVLRLYVHPDRWNEGIGTELLNEIGNSFYENRGFEKTGEAETQLDGTTRTENVYTRAV
ncbi:N-acetyltransferase [Halobacteriales archaeon QS_1_67_19]|nr:MAG: N-acetyltransferase [Halobacteriales archaeon QS_1_67_19]